MPVKGVNQDQMKNQQKSRIEAINEEKDQNSEAIIRVENPTDVHVDVATSADF